MENSTRCTSFAVIMRAMQEQSANLKGVVFGLGIAAFAAYQQFKLPVVLPVLLERYGYERTLAGGSNESAHSSLSSSGLALSFHQQQCARGRLSHLLSFSPC